VTGEAMLPQLLGTVMVAEVQQNIMRNGRA
jgi:hypothetical protein